MKLYCSASSSLTLLILRAICLFKQVSSSEDVLENAGEVERSGNQNKIGELYQAKEVENKNPRELLRMHGFQSENHYFKTKDGHHINLVRVVNAFVDRSHLRRPVLFNHGFFESATFFLINAKAVTAEPWAPICDNSSLLATINDQLDDNEALKNGPMLLANKGFDVWLMSERGTLFSRGHDFLSYKDPQYWDFSLDEFAFIDLPAAIEYIRDKTKCKKLAYCGHSQASWAMFALLSTEQRYNKIIEPFFAIAPIAYLKHVSTILRPLYTSLVYTLSGKLRGPFPPDSTPFRKGFGQFCGASSGKRKKLVGYFCDLFVNIMVGINSSGSKAGYYEHLFYSVSFKVIRHFVQQIISGRFERFDYGKDENLRVYNSTLVPQFPVEQITSRSMCFYHSKYDVLSTPKDVEHFKERLTVPLFNEIFIEKKAINHLDYIIGKTGSKIVFKSVLEIMEQFEAPIDEKKCLAFQKSNAE